MSDYLAVLNAVLENADLDDSPESVLADRVMTAGRDVESMRYFVSANRIGDLALKMTGRHREAFLTGQGQLALDKLGVGPILRYSEAYAAWSEGKWSPPPVDATLDGVGNVRAVARLAFLADVRQHMGAVAAGAKLPRHSA